MANVAVNYLWEGKTDPSQKLMGRSLVRPISNKWLPRPVIGDLHVRVSVVKAFNVRDSIGGDSLLLHVNCSMICLTYF